MSIILWIILGGLAGWLASKVTGNDAEMGVGANIVVGILGSLIGGWIFTSFFAEPGYTGFSLWSFLVAFVGSVILLLIVNAFRK